MAIVNGVNGIECGRTTNNVRWQRRSVNNNAQSMHREYVNTNNNNTTNNQSTIGNNQQSGVHTNNRITNNNRNVSVNKAKVNSHRNTVIVNVINQYHRSNGVVNLTW